MIFKDFSNIDWRTFNEIPIIAVYKNPLDYPGKYVARIWDANKPTSIVITKNSLEEIREIIPHSFVNIGRYSTDDPIIIECWI